MNVTDLKWREKAERRKAINADNADKDFGTEVEAETINFEEKDDEDIYFAPENGNVIFASAIDRCISGTPCSFLLFPLLSPSLPSSPSLLLRRALYPAGPFWVIVT